MLDNKALTGKYFFRELAIVGDAGGNATDARSLLGAITFNAAGQYSISAQQTLGTGPATAATGSGTYSVAPSGTVSLTDPLRNTLTINARWGAEALIGSTTEAPDNTFNFFVAIPAPVAPQSNIVLNGAYNFVSLEFPGATSANVKNGFITLQANGAGGFTNIKVFGHAANVNSGIPATQTPTGGTYALMGDGSGVAAFGNSAALLTGSKNLYVSRSGNVILGGSTTAGSQDLLVGIRALKGGATNASWSGLFWTAGLRVASDGTTAGYAGSLNALPTFNKTTLARRLHQAGSGGAIDVTLVNGYMLMPGGIGSSELTQVALGSAGDLFLTAGVNAADASSYELNFGIRMPNLSGTGLFLNPQGVVNGASFAPAGNPISPGEFITLYSQNIGPQTPAAGKPPYPRTLGGVGVTVNGSPAPLHYVGPNQINLLVPYATMGAKATIVVNGNGMISNSVDVPLATTAPGVFSSDQSGTGLGAVLHSDFSLVNDMSPTRRGETVLIFLTGLGAVTPAVQDGTAGGSNPVSSTNSPVNVFVAGRPATVVFSGLAPGFPGLYQINATVPLDVVGTGRLTLAIVTPNAFHCEVDLPVE
ncbi:MAG: hypothetical protein ACR2I2_02215 [Bryobacteraceae bacterium]